MKSFKLATFLGITALFVCFTNSSFANDSENNNLQLHDAIREGKSDLIDKYLTKQRVNSEDKYGVTPLHLAVRLGDLKSVKKLFKNGAKLNVVDSFEDTPLLDSTRNGSNAISKFLICNGAEKDVLDRYKKTPLEYAKRDKDIYIQALLESNDIKPLCKKLQIEAPIYNESKNEICGKIKEGFATDIQITISSTSVESNTSKVVNAKLDGNSYCATLDKKLDSSMDYLITAEANNSVDYSTVTFEIEKTKN